MPKAWPAEVEVYLLLELMPAPSLLMAILARSPSDRPRRPPPRCRRRRPRFRERNRRGSGVPAYGYLRWEWKQHCEQECHGRGRRIDSSGHLGAGVAPTSSTLPVPRTRASFASTTIVLKAMIDRVVADA